MTEKTIYEKLSKIQTQLKAPKNQYNSFGKYNYRNCEDILEAVKPLLNEQGLILTLSDKIHVAENGRTYIEAHAVIQDGTLEIGTIAYAREPDNKKGMDESQVTGASSSYARKYALNGLFLIDDTKDADCMNNTTKAQSAKPKEQITKKTVSDGVKQQAMDVLARFCELHGSSKQDIWDGIKKRPNFADTTAFWKSIYDEFNNDIQQTMKEANNVN